MRVQLRDLSSFRPTGYDKGRGVVAQALWFATMNLLFSAWYCPRRLRPWLLRRFGASVGDNVFIRHKVRVLWPWKLTIGDDSWIGEGVWLLNLEPIEIGADVCLSQEAFLCTGSHDHRSSTFGYRNAPIVVADGAWVGARAMVLPGRSVGRCAVVAGGETLRADLPDLTMLVGGAIVEVPEPT